ncbi:MAG: polymerase sigma-70 factor, subfamily [Bacteroidetes bacterium]|jgi:RNA polymerase sigma-70 factor (ECF subfamily)|nr:polymerase sigma-70 factor, subfamily [Bacteroidota bacterium]
MWSFRKKNYRTDEELAAEYLATGNRELVGDLFEKHVKTVFGVCLFYFKDKDVAKDVVMQIFEKLITDLRRSEVKNFKGWLSFVVRNHCISELRKMKTRQFVPESYLDFEMKETSYETEEAIASVGDDIMLDHMKNSLHLLKEKQRICVEMFYLKNMSYQQISEHMKLSLNEVKSSIQNGKRNLKLLIEEKLKDGHNAA